MKLPVSSFSVDFGDDLIQGGPFQAPVVEVTAAEPVTGLTATCEPARGVVEVGRRAGQG